MRAIALGVLAGCVMLVGGLLTTRSIAATDPFADLRRPLDLPQLDAGAP